MGDLVRSLQVENIDEIIPRVKEEFGDEASIVTHKQIKPKTMGQKPVYEVLVAVSEEDYTAHLKKMGRPLPSKKAGSSSNQNPNLSPNLNSNSSNKQANLSEDEAVILDFANSKNPYIQNAKNSLNLGASKQQGLAQGSLKERLSEVSSEISRVTNLNDIAVPNYNKKIDAVEKQIKGLSDKMNLLVDMMWDGKAENRQIIIPPEFASIYKQARESGMCENHLEAIMKATIENMPANMKSNPEAVQRYFNSLLRNILPCRVENEIKKQKIMMLVGPTGVGKTTTLAKLAFRYAYGERRYKTGIITLDTYRIGAVEQLFQYAKMMKLPIIDSIEPSDLDEAIKSLSNCEVILVDTMGNSQYDSAKLAKTKEFLAHSNAQIDVNLVISANTKFDDLMEVYKHFAFLDIDTLIITKFDETKAFGNIFSLIYETNIPLSFFSVGQEVPDDIELASSDFLVRCILEGFEKGKDNEQSSK